MMDFAWKPSVETYIWFQADKISWWTKRPDGQIVLISIFGKFWQLMINNLWQLLDEMSGDIQPSSVQNVHQDNFIIVENCWWKKIQRLQETISNIFVLFYFSTFDHHQVETVMIKIFVSQWLFAFKWGRESFGF